MWIGNTVIGSPRSPAEKLNVACVGVGGKGASDMGACRGENIVAICDTDTNRLNQAGSRVAKKAEKFTDYRKMLDRKDIDAVTVSTPDHNHAPAAMKAIKLGKHAFVQKPLTKTVHEARELRKAAREYKVATQMGNQGTSTSGLRKGVEVVQSGGIGNVTEIHVWTNRPVWPQGAEAIPTVPKAEKIPEHIKWSEWLGPAARPGFLSHGPSACYYSKRYLPFVWRGFWEFGTGALGDMACHTANLAFWACELEHPVAIEREEMVGNNLITYPTYSKIRFDFPARIGRFSKKSLPALKFFWYDGWTIKGGKKTHNKPPKATFKGHPINPSNSGSLMIGDKAMMYSPNDYGSGWNIFSKDEEYSKSKEWEPKEYKLPRSPGHAQEWLNACKDPKNKEKEPKSNFDYAALLTETILLGNLAMKVDGKIEWDSPNLRSTNKPEANRFVHYEYRKGYQL